MEDFVSSSSFKLKDGSKVSCEVYMENDGISLFPRPSRIVYYHDGNPVSFEGLRHLKGTVGVARREQ